MLNNFIELQEHCQVEIWIQLYSHFSTKTCYPFDINEKIDVLESLNISFIPRKCKERFEKGPLLLKRQR